MTTRDLQIISLIVYTTSAVFGWVYFVKRRDWCTVLIAWLASVKSVYYLYVVGFRLLTGNPAPYGMDLSVMLNIHEAVIILLFVVIRAVAKGWQSYE